MVKKYQACVYKTKLADGEIEWWAKNGATNQ